jgi:hypothetical protein
LRALIAVLWRGGLRIEAAPALAERDLDQKRGALLIRSGKGRRRREIGMDAWGFEQLRPWLEFRLELPVGPLFCVLDGPTRGHAWAAAGVRVELRRLAKAAAVRRRFAPHQLRHAHAIELAREAEPLPDASGGLWGQRRADLAAGRDIEAGARDHAAVREVHDHAAGARVDDADARHDEVPLVAGDDRHVRRKLDVPDRRAVRRDRLPVRGERLDDVAAAGELTHRRAGRVEVRRHDHRVLVAELDVERTRVLI